MSGHSKWHNIRLKKSKQDQARGKVFTKVSKEIMLAVKEGGPDPDANFRLSAAIDKAKQVNMPNSNIKRAIDKASGAGGDGDMEESVYEGYGPHGVAIMVETATDNKNRTIPEVRNIFSKHGGSMGEAGCVAWMFDKKGIITVKADQVKEDELMEVALEAGAEDMSREEGLFEITTEPSNFAAVTRALKARKIPIESSDLSMIPQNEIDITTVDAAKTIINLMDALEDNDDVQKVHANFNIPDDLMAKVEA
ncbi:MAG: YebC/PmpR family DNA-binding transcriptional regulator [Vulcanimicrobiota bacterium]